MYNLQEEPTVKHIARTPRIYAALDGRHVDHQSAMVEIEAFKILPPISTIVA